MIKLGTILDLQCLMLEQLKKDSLENMRVNTKLILLYESDEGEKILLCKPQTYMNLSGEAVAPLVRFYKIEVKDILVVHDEIDFVTGRLALKLG